MMPTSELIISISPQRFSTYKAIYLQIVPSHSMSNEYREIMFYMHVQKIYSHFFIPVQVLEVTLRNRIHNAMSVHYGTDDWFELLLAEKFCSYVTNKVFLDTKKQALKDFRKYSIPNTPGFPSIPARVPMPEDYVGRLNFGYWVELLQAKYRQTLFWQTKTDIVFPCRGNTKIGPIYNSMKRVKSIRNRLYHYEPLWKNTRKFQDIDDFCRNIEEQYFLIIKLIGYCSAEQTTLLEEDIFLFELEMEVFKSKYE